MIIKVITHWTTHKCMNSQWYRERKGRKERRKGMREGADKETLPYGNAESQLTNVERIID